MIPRRPAPSLPEFPGPWQHLCFRLPRSIRAQSLAVRKMPRSSSPAPWTNPSGLERAVTTDENEKSNLPELTIRHLPVDDHQGGLRDDDRDRYPDFAQPVDAIAAR